MSKFSDILSEYIKKIVTDGLNGGDNLSMMLQKLRSTLDLSIPTETQQLDKVRKVLESSVKKAVSSYRLAKVHPEVSAMTIEHISPKFRVELNRRILANADLIKLHRSTAIDKTLQRFAGWASSVPINGSEALNRTDVKKDIMKSVRTLDYERRRREIDQGHKMIAAIDEVIALETGAIAMRWHSNWRQPGYDYREKHKERDGKWYAIRGNWAIRDGLMKVGANGYTDQITAPAFEPYCSCSGVYARGLRKLPLDMLTKKGEAQLASN